VQKGIKGILPGEKTKFKQCIRVNARNIVSLYIKRKKKLPKKFILEKKKHIYLTLKTTHIENAKQKNEITCSISYLAQLHISIVNFIQGVESRMRS
jgi:hypothetical protein